MGERKIRLGSQLVFDEQQEADIIQAFESLNACHKSGQFLSNVIRIAFDCPEIMDNNSGKYEKGVMINILEAYGVSHIRKNFFDQLTKEVNKVKSRVDEMYSIVLKTYILGQMGKTLGLEEKAGNEILAQFIVEKQLKELQDTLGISLTSSVYASNRKQDIEKIADDALEYIIESYSDIVNELKAIVMNTQAMSVQAAPTQVINNAEQLTNNTDTVNTNIQQSNVEEPKEDIVDDEEDEIIDFGNADFGALGNFFGE